MQKHLAKPREIVKMPSEPCNHESEEESPEHLEITHKVSHSITDFLKPSKPIAPAEETMSSKETTKTEAKVLIQPIQEATTDTSAPQDLTIT